MWKKLLGYGSLILILGIAVAVYLNYPKLGIVSGYAAKKMCSCTFIAERPQADIQAHDLAFGPLALSSTEIDHQNKKVTSSVFGLSSRTAEYRGLLGCVLLKGKDDYDISFPNTKLAKSYNPDTLPYPYGNNEVTRLTSHIDHDMVKLAANEAFDENNQLVDKRTRAVLVLHRDTLIYERYADGYDKETELLGWSMTKSIMNAWVGMLVKDGQLDISNKSLFPSWKNDDRKKITLKHLLNMCSGLEWSEVYSEISPATRMLYDSEDNAAVAIRQDLEAEPGTHWEYSSGTSNIISRYLRNQYATHEDYLVFPYNRIFRKLNMNSTVLETDESGTYIGSSYCYATPRDWARFGTLYLNDGVWNGERLLPEGWTKFTKSIAEHSGGKYGAQFWTNGNGSMNQNAPETMYSCNGFEGQIVAIIPSKDLVIVRMGLSENFDFDSLLSGICDAVN